MGDSTTEAACGLVIRAYVNASRERSFFEKLQASVSPPVAALLAKPPLPTSWFPMGIVHELAGAVAAGLGEEGAHAFGRSMMRGSIGPVLLPLIRGFVSVLGASPESVFNHLEPITSMAMRGIQFKYLPGHVTSGVLEMTSQAPTPRSSLLVWAGCLSFAFDALGMSSRRLEVLGCTDDGLVARFSARW